MKRRGERASDGISCQTYIFHLRSGTKREREREREREKIIAEEIKQKSFISALFNISSLSARLLQRAD